MSDKDKEDDPFLRAALEEAECESVNAGFHPLKKRRPMPFANPDLRKAYVEVHGTDKEPSIASGTWSRLPIRPGGARDVFKPSTTLGRNTTPTSIWSSPRRSSPGNTSWNPVMTPPEQIERYRRLSLDHAVACDEALARGDKDAAWKHFKADVLARRRICAIFNRLNSTGQCPVLTDADRATYGF